MRSTQKKYLPPKKPSGEQQHMRSMTWKEINFKPFGLKSFQIFFSSLFFGYGIKSREEEIINNRNRIIYRMTFPEGPSVFCIYKYTQRMKDCCAVLYQNTTSSAVCWLLLLYILVTMWKHNTMSGSCCICIWRREKSATEKKVVTTRGSTMSAEWKTDKRASRCR